MNYYWSLTATNYPSEVSRELADTVGRLLSVIFEKSWRLGNVPEDWEKAHVVPSPRKA